MSREHAWQVPPQGSFLNCQVIDPEAICLFETATDYGIMKSSWGLEIRTSDAKVTVRDLIQRCDFANANEQRHLLNGTSVAAATKHLEWDDF
jgi:hypothetical protein